MEDSSTLQTPENGKNSAAFFEKQGYAILDKLLSGNECRTIDTELETLLPRSVGTRNLLDASWCIELARKVRVRLHEFLPADYVAFQCTFFEKSIQTNWLVSSHQDLGIPVRERVEHPALSAWSKKEGALYVQPPAHVLEQLIAVRLHLDDCTSKDGPLKVVAASHRLGRLPEEKTIEIKEASGEKECLVPRGGALLMRPLLLHSSSKSSGEGKRRVLHFIYGPPRLPFGLAWRCTI